MRKYRNRAYCENWTLQQTAVPLETFNKIEEKTEASESTSHGIHQKEKCWN